MEVGRNIIVQSNLNYPNLDYLNSRAQQKSGVKVQKMKQAFDVQMCNRVRVDYNSANNVC